MKKISTKVAIVIIALCTVVVLGVSFFTASKCRYSESFLPSGLLPNQPETEASRLAGCYFKWQCQLIESGEGREICNSKFTRK